jgi:hypothetical protein
MNFADGVYEADRHLETLKGVIERCVKDFARQAINDDYECSHDSFEYTFIKRLDPYDQSIEFWSEPGVELSEFEQECLWTLGFQRCWVCYIGVSYDAPREQRERYYYDKVHAAQVQERLKAMGYVKK